jgi:hypothetical protein
MNYYYTPITIRLAIKAISVLVVILQDPAEQENAQTYYTELLEIAAHLNTQEDAL